MAERKKAKEGKRYEELTFTDDFIFCKVLQNNPDLCCELLELILSRKVTGIVTMDSQKSIVITSDAKVVRFDVYLDDDQKNVYDIEMQTTLKRHLPKRMRYYQGMLDLNLIERGADYADLNKSYIIFLCLDNPYPSFGLHKYSFRNICLEDPNLEMGDEATKIILSVQGNVNDISEEMEAFLRYLGGDIPRSDFTKKLNKEVLKAREHKEWRGEYMTLLEKLEEARIDGRTEGIELGKEHGKILGTVETLRNLGKNDTEIADWLMSRYALDRETAEKELKDLKGTVPRRS